MDAKYLTNRKILFECEVCLYVLLTLKGYFYMSNSGYSIINAKEI